MVLHFLFPLFQALDDVVVVDEIADGREGDGQKDACHSKETAADDQGDQDPDGGNAQPFAEEPGLEDIAVEGLQDDCEEQEPERVPGVDQDQDKGPDGGPDHGAEGRRQVGHAHDHGNDRDIRHIHDQHEDPVQDPNDQTVQDIKGDILDQDRIAPVPEGRRAVVDMVGHHGLEEPDKTFFQFMIVQHQIDGQYKGNDPLKYVAAKPEGGVYDLVDVFRQDPGDRLQEFVTRGNELGQIDVMPGRKIAQLHHQPLHGPDISVHVPGEEDDTVDDLGDQSHHQDRDKENHGQDREQDRERMPEPGRLHLVQHIFGVGGHQRIQDVGHYEGQDDRSADLQDALHDPSQGPQMGQQHIEQNR